MFKEIYKAANDDIKADDELLNKVLANKRKRVRLPVYKYSAIAASVAAVAVSIAVVPSMLNRQEDVVVEDRVVPTFAPVSSPDINISVSKDIKAESIAEKPADAPEKTETKPVATSKYATENKTEKQQEAFASQVPVSQKKADFEEYGVVSNTESLAAADMAETLDRQKVSTYIKTVVLNVNDTDYGGFASNAAYDDEAALDSGVYTPTQWTMDDYFNYLGEDVIAKVSLPSDFSYIGENEIEVSLDENGKPMQDSVIFPYSGDDGRYVTVITSKQTLTAESYLEDERYAKSDINGNDAVVIGGEDNYKSYMKSGEVSYIITSDGVTEDELGETLVSIGG